MNKHIGIIAYDFPPLNTGGSQRPFLLASSMSKAGFEVTIFTVKEDCYENKQLTFNNYTEQLRNCKIIRTDLRKRNFIDHIKNKNYFSLVDDIASRWEKYLAMAIKREHAISKIDILFVTCPPFSLATLGRMFKEKLDLPFVLDLRDAWSQWVITPYASYLHYYYLLNLEKRCLDEASLVTFTSKTQKDDLVDVHKQLDIDKFIYMPNGFNQYNEVTKRKDSKIRIVYTGVFYYNPKSANLITKKWYKKKVYQYFQYVPKRENWKYRSPYYFFKILSRLRKLDPQLFAMLEVVFAGENPDWFAEMVREFNLEGVVSHVGYKTRAEASKLIGSSDFVLLTSAKVVGGRDYSVAGKTFEYFSFQKPILAVVCEGEQKDVLKKYEASLILNPEECLESAQLLLNELRNQQLGKPDSQFADNFLVPNNFNEFFTRL